MDQGYLTHMFEACEAAKRQGLIVPGHWRSTVQRTVDMLVDLDTLRHWERDRPNGEWFELESDVKAFL